MGRLAAEFYANPSRAMRVVGVTGTKGKTTTTWLIRGIFEEMLKLTGMIGGIEYALAEDLVNDDGTFITELDSLRERDSSTPFHFTPYPTNKKRTSIRTLNSLKIQQLMACFVDRGATATVLECSSIGLDQGHFDYVDFDVAVNMNVFSDYNDYHLTFENCLEAKLKLFRMLVDSKRQWAIINTDDPFAKNFAQMSEKVPIVTFSVKQRVADVCIEKIETSIFETSILITLPLNTQLKITTQLLGKSNVYNILGAVSTGIALGIPLKSIVNGIETVETVPGCAELIEEGHEFSVIVDTAKKKESFSRILDYIRECKPSRIITVFGCCGDRDKSLRAYMGEIAHLKSDVVILTNDNPRSEAPDQIIADIVAGWPEDILLQHSWFQYPWYQDIGRVPQWYGDQALWAQSETCRYIIEDRYLAIRYGIYMAQKNDVVIVSGKGHDDSQYWANHYVYRKTEFQNEGEVKSSEHIIKGWFDDRLECRNALSKLKQLKMLFPGLDRSILPWTWPGVCRRHPLEEWDDEVLASTPT